MNDNRLPRSLAASLLAVLATGHPTAQSVPTSVLGGASNVIVPQYRSFSSVGQAAVRIERVQARVRILEQTAQTTLQIELHNTSARQEEAVLLLPVPGDCAVSEFAFDGTASEPTARLLPADEARRTYDEIVRKLRDPGLLEFAGARLIRTSVFPIAAGARSKIRLSYDHVLEGDGERFDYVLLRSESLAHSAPWSLELDLKTKARIAMVYSPTHEIDTDRQNARHLRVRLDSSAGTVPGPFRLSYLLESTGDGRPAASLFAYPDPKIGGGYFLLLGSAPRKAEQARRLRREVTIVLDRSGSMAGAKFDQALDSARQVLEALEDGEAFNVIDYSTTVERFAPGPVVKSPESTEQVRRYLKSLRPLGGTNIHDALVEALRQSPAPTASDEPARLPLVLFLTDGLPTVGNTSETGIRKAVTNGNPHARRIFTFGVGEDVNVPLLDRIAEQTRAASTYVLPGQDIELQVARVFRKLSGPALAGPELVTLDATGNLTTRRVRERYPQTVPDLFEGDQLLVLGQYRDEEPLRFVLRGHDGKDVRTFRFEFSLDHASTKNAFVPRLWASRRVADLVDRIRQAGADDGGLRPAGFDPFADPAMRELRDEILRLSTEFGILTEYTSFLATEGMDLGNWDVLALNCANSLDTRAWRSRSGSAAINQGLNLDRYGKQQAVLNPLNNFYEPNLERFATTTVQQICDRAYFNQGSRWIDGRLLQRSAFEPSRVIRFGSPEHLALVQRFAKEGRAGALSLSGEIVLDLDGEVVAIRN